MPAAEIKFDTKYVKSYASKAKMERAIGKYPCLRDERYIVAIDDNARLYPIFVIGNSSKCQPIWVAQCGFACV